MFSKKATKFEEIFTVDLTSRGKCQIDVEDLVSFCGLLRKHELHHKILQNFSQKGDTINIHVLFSRKKKYLTKNSYLVTCDSRSWKGDDDSAIFIANVPENLATSGNKISVMFRIHSHRLLYDLVKICDPGFQFKFGCKVKANTS